MSNGSSVLDESVSVLFVYTEPEIERSKVLFEEICRSFDGNDMQGKYDQMLLFEKLSEGLFDDMILIGLCMYAMVSWKSDDSPTSSNCHGRRSAKKSRCTWNRTVVSRTIERRLGTVQVAAGEVGITRQVMGLKIEQEKTALMYVNKKSATLMGRRNRVTKQIDSGSE
jgi:hypothetical protein